MNGTLATSGTLLEARARRIEALAVRLEAARRRLPSRGDVVWRGPAALVYWAALDHLGAEFAAAQQQLIAAAAASRRAASIVMAAANG